MNMLIRAFRDPPTNNGEVLLLIRTWGMGIDKGGFTGDQIPISYDPFFHLFRRHYHLSLIHQIIRAVAEAHS